jgi:hypothetical protein
MNPIPRMVAAAMTLLCASAARAGDEGPIQDNSFLVEEAYNQEPGVIQHIGLFTRSVRTGEWVFSFTEEWPARGQTHQASVTLQGLGVGEGNARTSGLGDALLNYRWQAAGSGDAPVAVAPRLSAILPVGNARKGMGAGGAGLQVLLPVSAVLGERFVGHSNVGATWLPDAGAPGARGQLVGVNLAQGLVVLVHHRVNVMLEAAYQLSELSTRAGTRRTESLFLSPGLRGAIDVPGGLQIVAGVAMPFGVGPSAGERLLLGYLSFEHPVTNDPW